MKVILTEDVKGIGKKGQLIEAADGHAKNFLLPRKLAVEATKANMNELDQKKKSAEAKLLHNLESAREMAKRLEALTIKITVKTGANGKLFGSVTNKEIAAALFEQTGIELDRKKIVVDEPIKVIGEKTVDIKLHPEVTGKLKVELGE